MAQVVAQPHERHAPLVHGEVVGTGKDNLPGADVFPALRVQFGVEREGGLEPRAEQVPIFGQRERAPRAVAVAVRRPVQRGQRVDLLPGQVEGDVAAVERARLRHVEVGRAITLLAGKEQAGDGVGVRREVGVEDAGGVGHHHHADVILRGVADGFDLQRGRERDAPPVGDGDAGSQGRVKAAADGRVGHRRAVGSERDAQIAAVVVVCVAARQEDFFQAQCHRPQPVILLTLLGGLDRGVFPRNRHGKAVILAHREARQIPVVAVGVDDLCGVQIPAFGVVAPDLGVRVAGAERGGRAEIGEHLDEPHEAHLLRRAAERAVVGEVGDARGEGHAPAAGSVGNDVHRRVHQHGARLILVAGDDVVGGQGGGINHPVVVRSGGEVGDGDADRVVPGLFDEDEVVAVGHVRHADAADGPGEGRRAAHQRLLAEPRARLGALALVEADHIE